jgi:RNA polymerase sigma factor (sigma-70 family)
MECTPGSDAELLVAIGARDLAAMRALYERHTPWLTLRLLRRCADTDVVADAVQDTMLAVWQKPGGFRGEGEVTAWLWGIAIRRLVSRLRGRRDVLLGGLFDGGPPDLAAEEQVLLSVEYGDAGQALARLSPQLRAVVQAVVLDGLTTKEAARMFGMPQASVKSRLARAKVQLRAALAEGMS